MKIININFQLYQDVNKLISIIHDQTALFPTAYRSNLGKDLNRDCLKLINSTHRIYMFPDVLEYFYQFLDDVEAVRTEISICYDLQLVEINSYSDIIVLIRSIQRQTTNCSNFRATA